MRTTHTFATLEVSRSAFDEIARKLFDAGYGHAFIGDAIDMHGIGLVRAADEDSPQTEGSEPSRDQNA